MSTTARGNSHGTPMLAHIHPRGHGTPSEGRLAREDPERDGWRFRSRQTSVVELSKLVVRVKQDGPHSDSPVVELLPPERESDAGRKQEGARQRVDHRTSLSPPPTTG